MRIAICEDEASELEGLRETLAVWPGRGCRSLDIRAFTSGAQLLEAWRVGYSFALAFLDIHLGSGLDGIQVAQAIRERDESVPLVFLTSRLEYVLSGYEVQAWRYLVKPARAADCFACLDHAAKLDEAKRRHILVTSEGRSYRVPIKDILSAEAFSHYVEIRTASASFRARLRLSDLLETLGDGFYQCHRSHIVNLDRVESYGPASVRVGGDDIPLNKESAKALPDLLGRTEDGETSHA
jgi:Response regulator of the LytR/AlgR family